MFKRMKDQAIQWPALTGRDVTHLMAYLNER